MYVPIYDAILQNLGFSRDTLVKTGNVTIPTSMFMFLLQIAVAQSEFDDETYKTMNPDIASAVKLGDIKDTKMHYIMYGYFEGRYGGAPKVDDNWYKQKYPDVAVAIDKGSINSASEHFYIAGSREWRSPGQNYQSDVVEWKRAITRSEAV